MIPICYSESLSNGAATSCAGFMASATEQFIKELLSSIYCRTRSNMPGGSVNSVQTHRFKSQLQIEEDQFSRHEIMKVPGTGLFPVEAKEASTRPGLAMHDLKVAFDVGDILLGQFPLVGSKIMSSYAEGEYEDYQTRRIENFAMIKENRRAEQEREQRIREMDQDVEMKGSGITTNRSSGVPINGINGFVGRNGFAYDDEDDDDDWGWEGGNAEGRMQLVASLDACLAMEA